MHLILSICLLLRPREKMTVLVNILEINWVHVGRLTELLFFYFLFLPIYIYVIQDKDLTLTVLVQIWQYKLFRVLGTEN